MMHKLVFILLISLAMLPGSGCQRESRRAPAAGAVLSLTAVPSPAVVGEARLVVRVLDSAGSPVDDAAIAVKGDMTHAGMAPVLAESDAGGEDGYYNIPFEWTMGGDWVVTVEAVLADGTTARQRFDLAVLTVDEAACRVEEDE